jgi:hypothetical protein
MGFLVHADRSKHSVVDDDEDRCGAILPCGRQFLARHHEVAVAGDADDSAPGGGSRPLWRIAPEEADGVLFGQEQARQEEYEPRRQNEKDQTQQQHTYQRYERRRDVRHADPRDAAGGKEHRAGWW